MLHRYLLCLEASTSVAQRVHELEQLLQPVVTRPRKTTAPVHITLLLADIPQEHEPLLLSAIEAGLRNARAFDLHLKGITHFSDKRTIFIDPVEKDKVMELLAGMPAATAALPEEVRLTNHAHMSLATNLERDQFGPVWAALANVTFEEQMRVDSLALYARPLSQSVPYALLKRFDLIR